MYTILHFHVRWKCFNFKNNSLRVRRPAKREVHNVLLFHIVYFSVTRSLIRVGEGVERAGQICMKKVNFCTPDMTRACA